MTAQILTTTRELHSRVSDGIRVGMLGRLSARSCGRPPSVVAAGVRSFHGRGPRSHPDDEPPPVSRLTSMARHPHPDEQPLRVVVAGAGVGGLETMVALRSLRGRRVELTLVAPQDDFIVHALEIFEPFGLGVAQRYPVAALAAELDAVFRHDAVARVDRDERTVHLQSGDELAYDRLVLAVGAFPYPAYEHGVCFKRAPTRRRSTGSSTTYAAVGRAPGDRRSAGVHVDAAGLRAGPHGCGPGRAATADPGHVRDRTAWGCSARRRVSGCARRWEPPGSNCSPAFVPLSRSDERGALAGSQAGLRPRRSPASALRARTARASPATATASSSSTTPSGCATTTTSSPSAMRRPAHTSRAVWPPSRPMSSPSRSRGSWVPSIPRARTVPSCAASCGPPMAPLPARRSARGTHVG